MFSRKSRLSGPCLTILFAASLPALSGAADVDALRIGTTGALTGQADAPREKAALESLHSFIKDETGRDNEIIGPKSWREIADQMAAGQLALGVFQGHEFAWAREKHPDLKPLALAVNGSRYPVACVLARRDDSAADFAGLQGQALTLPAANRGFVRLYLEKQSAAGGKSLEGFFAKITLADDVEDALDDVVDGVVQVAAVERTALEAYQRRKPGRFNRLQEVTRSQPFPPTVVAYYGSSLDEDSLRRFKDGLLGAAAKPKGQTLLNLVRLTGFEAVPEDFGRVLGETRKAYPPPEAKAK